ncbi:hypothetical protein MNBD_GAMMA12-2919 [hydrothermal vent metagenome]|uniref:IS4 family transposase n=1 Tax=hydrothermal vent metagenome TaxID=652676 RepID=A0A3B0YVW1_9ZZZZ
MNSSAKIWVKGELSSACFGDQRLNSRFIQIAGQLASKFGGNISSSFNQWKEIKAAYRFFSNDKVNTGTILSPHIEQTIQRIRSLKRILLIQDTTYFNFCNRPKTSGLDITQRSELLKEAEGLMLHNTLAITDTGIPLGLLDQHFIDRKELQGENHQAKRNCRYWNHCVDQKESVRWINVLRKTSAIDFGKTQIIHVADRESDFYEFYRDATDLGEEFVIRAARNRGINKVNRREPSSEYLFDYLQNKRAQGKVTVNIQVNGASKFRDVALSVIYTKVSIPPPPNKTKKKDGALPMIELFAVMAIERKPPAGHDPLCWVLLTNLPIVTLEDAIEKINWYSLRWNIELFHKVLKSGCAVEKAQLRDAERLKKYIVLKSIIAWRLFWLSRTQKQKQDNSCLEVLTRREWTLLYKKMNKSQPPDTPPTIGEAYVWIAKLGGYIGRNTDPPPGMISLWKGWQRLMDMVEDYRDICG